MYLALSQHALFKAVVRPKGGGGDVESLHQGAWITSTVQKQPPRMLIVAAGDEPGQHYTDIINPAVIFICKV